MKTPSRARARALCGAALAAAAAVALAGCQTAETSTERTGRSTYFSDRAAGERKLEKNFSWQQMGMPTNSPYK